MMKFKYHKANGGAPRIIELSSRLYNGMKKERRKVVENVGWTTLENTRSPSRGALRGGAHNREEANGR